MGREGGASTREFPPRGTEGSAPVEETLNMYNQLLILAMRVLMFFRHILSHTLVLAALP